MIASNFYRLKNRALNSQLLNDSFWAVFGNILAKGLALAGGIVVARFLGKDVYGEYGIIRNTLMSIAIFSTFGLGYTVTKFVSEFKKNKPECINLVLRYSNNITFLFSGVMAIALFVCVSYISQNIFEAPHLTNPLRLVSIWIIFNAITTTQVGVLAGLGQFKGMVRVNTIVGIATFITSSISTYFWQLNGALASLMATQILNWYLNNRLVRQTILKEVGPKQKEKKLLKEILKLSLPVALQETLFPITSWFIGIILIKLSGFGELGLYSAAMQWNALILYVPGILRNVVLSHLSESNKDTLRHDRVMKITLIINFITTFIPFLIVFMFSNYIVKIYGIGFEGLRGVINVAVLTTIFSSLSNVYAQAYLSKGKNWLMFKFRLVRDFGMITMSYLVIKYTNHEIGALGVVYSSLIMNAIFLIIIVIFYEIIKKEKNEYNY